jgi:hypothetical protein
MPLTIGHPRHGDAWPCEAIHDSGKAWLVFVPDTVLV